MPRDDEKISIDSIIHNTKIGGNLNILTLSSASKIGGIVALRDADIQLRLC